ncbi:MAG: hypothetical protein K2K84_10350 [Muribaculaceae bacterium]|nr:hypothetical protein [Muribaculaceae bacterium]
MKKLLVTFLLLFASFMPSFTALALPAAETESAGEGQELSEQDILKICKWYITTPPSDDPQITELRMAASTAIIRYTIDTKKFTIQFGNAASKALDLGSGKDTGDLMMVYMAGEVIYLLEHNLSRNDADSFAAAMQDVMKFYTMLPKQSVKSLKKYLKMDQSERQAAFVKLYNDNK